MLENLLLKDSIMSGLRERMILGYRQKLELRRLLLPRQGEIQTPITTRLAIRRSRFENIALQTRLAFASNNDRLEQAANGTHNAEFNDHQRSPESEHKGLAKRFTNWVQERVEKRLNKNLTEIFTNPENHRKDIEAEVFRIFQQATASPLRQGVINTKVAMQAFLFGFAGEHAPIPIAFIPIPFLPVITIPFLGTFHGWPITISGFIGDTLTYNIPNLIQAFSEKRVKKGTIYSAFAVLCNLHIPIVFNTFWYELAFRPLERRHTIKFTEKMSEIIADPTHEHYDRFADTVSFRISKTEQRFHSIPNILTRLDTNVAKSQTKIEHHSERITIHEDRLDQLPIAKKSFIQRAKSILSESGWRRWTNKAWIKYHENVKQHHVHNEEIIQLARKLVTQQNLPN